MKTTVVIADALLEEAKERARSEGRTLKDLIDEGLRLVLAKPGSGKSGYKMQDHSFGGDGLLPHLAGANWEQLRAIAREDRG